MANVSLPFMNAYGLIGQILNKIKQAKEPSRFTQDYLSTQLGFSGGSAKAFIPLAKKMGLLGSDGIPTELYKKFRNSNDRISQKAIADAMKVGYRDLFERNEYAYSLSSNDLKGLIMEFTGMEENSQSMQRMCKTFEAFKQFADFDISENEFSDAGVNNANTRGDVIQESISSNQSSGFEIPNYKMNLAYTINLNLPDTDDISVFNAIFKSLKENLLK